jgi:hypothetical protein
VWKVEIARDPAPRGGSGKYYARNKKHPCGLLQFLPVCRAGRHLFFISPSFTDSTSPLAQPESTRGSEPSRHSLAHRPAAYTTPASPYPSARHDLRSAHSRERGRRSRDGGNVLGGVGAEHVIKGHGGRLHGHGKG